MSSGIDREGQPRSSRRYVMSKRGNDLVRRYLWMQPLCRRCELPATRAGGNVPPRGRPATRKPQSHRHRACHAQLLHLVFAVWTTDKPFDPNHCIPGKSPTGGVPAADKMKVAQGRKRTGLSHKPESKPAEEVVTATCTVKVAAAASIGEGTYTRLRPRQAAVAAGAGAGASKPGCSTRCGSGPQHAAAFHPIHPRGWAGPHLQREPPTTTSSPASTPAVRQASGDVIDLWAALHHQSGPARGAAAILIRTFNLESLQSPPHRQKRNG